MLNRAEFPVAWAMLMYELDDAREQLDSLVDEMSESGAIDETDFEIKLGHVFAHLNRAWHGRNDENLDQESPEQREQRSRFPDDLKPIG